MPGGGNLVVGGGDGGVVPPEVFQQQGSHIGVENQKFSGGSQAGIAAPGAGEVGFGNAAAPAPAYSSGLGEPLGTQGLQGQDSKR